MRACHTHVYVRTCRMTLISFSTQVILIILSRSLHLIIVLLCIDCLVEFIATFRDPAYILHEGDTENYSGEEERDLVVGVDVVAQNYEIKHVKVSGDRCNDVMPVP